MYGELVGIMGDELEQAERTRTAATTWRMAHLRWLSRLLRRDWSWIPCLPLGKQVSRLPFGKQVSATKAKNGARRSRDVRGRVFAAALRAFATHDYAEVSVDEIVRSARTTKPMVYYYFGNKSGLYQAVAAEAFAVLRGGHEEASDVERDPIARLRAFVRSDFAHMRRNPDLARFLYRSAWGAPRGAPALDHWALFLPTFQLVTSIVEAAQRKGKIARRTPAPIAALPLFGLISMWTQMHLGGALGAMLSDEEADRVVALYLRGVSR
jgi:AcrR family transcriptional regulator